MKIFINNRQVDTDERTEVFITLSVASQSKLETSRTGYSKTIRLPMTNTNRQILGMPEDVNARYRFNHGTYTARIEKEGCIILEGVPCFIESVQNGDGYYILNIAGSGREWIERASHTLLNKLGIEFNETFSGENILQSWTWDKPVRFLPVHRPDFDVDNTAASLFSPMNVLSTANYHPFLHVGTMIRRIFTEAGYTLQSNFANGALFDSLYISGNCPSSDSEAKRQKMDFKAGRLTDSMATADRFGRVYATPYSHWNTVGDIVQTIDPAQNIGGIVAADVFSKGGYFRKHIDGHWEFAPPEAVTVAFEYHLVYRTDYKMVDGRLQGFDKVYLGDAEHSFQLRLPFPDKRGEMLYAGHQYLIVIHKATLGDNFAFRLANGIIVSNFNGGTKTIIIPIQLGDQSGYSLNCLLPNGEIITAEEAGFAYSIYDGITTTSGSVEVEVTFRSAPEEIGPGNPKRFYNIYFGGAAEGQSMTLHHGTSIRPIFTQGMTEGEKVDFPFVAAHDGVTCFDLIKALKQMFNLYFLTDRSNGVVYMEPRSDFYAQETIIDLSQRIDLSRPVIISDPGAEALQVMTFCYRDAPQNLGVWSVRMANRLAKAGEKRHMNPLFHTSENSRGSYSRAPSASLLRAETSEITGDMNFPMKIVRYMGLQPLDGNQIWGWPDEWSGRYPLVAFHEPEKGVSLAFEDREGIQGLHRFWDNNLEFLNFGNRVEVYIDIQPQEIEQFVQTTDRKNNFRSKYRLSLGGESAIYLIEEIVDYNPASDGPTKCVFIKES